MYVNMFVNIIYLVNVYREKMIKMDVFIGYYVDICVLIIFYICYEFCEEYYDDSNSNSKISDEEEEEMDDIDEWVDDNKDKVCNLEEKIKFYRNVN